MMGYHGYNVDGNASLWQDAGMPRDSDDLLTTMRTVMVLARDDPDIVESLNGITTFMRDEFSPKNADGPVAPRRVWSMRTAVLIKRLFVGAEVGEDGQTLSLNAELDLHENPEVGDTFPAPANADDAVLLPPYASRLFEGLFRVICVDVRQIKADVTKAIQSLIMVTPPEQVDAMRVTVAARTTILMPWKDFIKKLSARIMGPVGESYSLHRRMSEALVSVTDFQRQFQQFTPGMGALGALARYVSERQTQQPLGLFAGLRLPHGDLSGDSKMVNLGLQMFRRICHLVATANNNADNVHVVALCLLVVLGSGVYDPDGGDDAAQPRLYIHGPSGLGKSWLMRFIMEVMIPLMAEWVGRQTPASGHGNGDTFHGTVFHDDAQRDLVGVGDGNDSRLNIIRAATSDKGHAAELTTSMQWDQIKQRSADGRNAIRTATVDGGIRRDVLTETTDLHGVIVSFNILYYALGATARTRAHSVHMGNRTADLLGGNKADKAALDLVREECRDMFGIHGFLQWFINTHMLPNVEMAHVKEFRLALQRQISHEHPDADAWGDTRTWGRINMACRSITILGAIAGMGLSGAGRDDKGRMSHEEIIREAPATLFCPISTFIYAAELYEVTGPRLLIDVVTELRLLMGLKYDPNNGLCDRDPDYWDNKPVHLKPPGTITFGGNYVVRSGYLELPKPSNNSNNSSAPSDRKGAFASYSAYESHDSHTVVNRLIAQLAKDIQARLGARYPPDDVLGALHRLTCGMVFNRPPGLDVHHMFRTGSQRQTAVPGLRFTANGIEVHQRVFYCFRYGFYADLINALMTTSTPSFATGMRATTPSETNKGQFDVVQWGVAGYADVKKSDLIAVGIMLKDATTRLNDLEAEKKKEDEDAVKQSGEQKQKTYFVQHAQIQRDQKYEPLFKVAKDEIKLYKDAQVAIHSGMRYATWCEAHLNQSRLKNSTAKDWASVELAAHKAFLARLTITPYDKHWVVRTPELQTTYGLIMDASARLCEHTLELKAGDTPHVFMQLVDQATKAVIAHAKKIQEMSASLRPMSIACARHLWDTQIRRTLRVPALLHLISGGALDVGLARDLVTNVFLMHREIHAARDAWCVLRKEYQTLALSHGKSSLYRLYDPECQATRTERLDTERLARSVVVDIRSYVERINECSAQLGADPINYATAQVLISRIDCSDALIQAVLRPEMPTAAQIREAVHAILASADIPRQAPLPTALLRQTSVSDDGGVVDEKHHRNNLDNMSQHSMEVITTTATRITATRRTRIATALRNAAISTSLQIIREGGEPDEDEDAELEAQLARQQDDQQAAVAQAVVPLEAMDVDNGGEEFV